MVCLTTPFNQAHLPRVEAEAAQHVRREDGVERLTHGRTRDHLVRGRVRAGVRVGVRVRVRVRVRVGVRVGVGVRVRVRVRDCRARRRRWSRPRMPRGY